MKTQIRDLTRQLIEALRSDQWPSPAVCIDFGIRSSAHLGALQYAVLSDGATAERLDAALGKGGELQKLIGPKNPYRGVTFHTDWDDMPEEPEDARPQRLSTAAHGPEAADGRRERGGFMEQTTKKQDDRTPAREALRADVAEAVEDVLWYLWQEAQEAFIADEPEPGEDHIFRSLVAVDGWLHGHEATAEDFIEAFCSEDDKATARARVRSFRG